MEFTRLLFPECMYHLTSSRAVLEKEEVANLDACCWDEVQSTNHWSRCHLVAMQASETFHPTAEKRNLLALSSPICDPVADLWFLMVRGFYHVVLYSQEDWSCHSFFFTVRSLVQCATSLKAFWHCLSRAETQTGTNHF